MPPPSVPVDFTKPIDRSNLKGKTALITGGASGIGAGTVRALAEAGAFVIIADINPDLGHRFCKELLGEGYVACFVHVDVTSWSSQVQAFKETLEKAPKGSIDIAIACAGISLGPMLQDAPFTSMTSGEAPEPPEKQIAMINVNLIGAMYTATLAIHHWRRQQTPEGKDNILILVSSDIAYIAPPGATGYTASKMGLRGFWKSLRSTPEFATLFRTNLLAPHIVRTPMTAALQPICDEYGFEMTEVGDCVECLVRICCDGGVRGRAVQVNPRGSWFDLGDDFENLDGAKVVREHWEETRGLFEVLSPGLHTS